MILFSICEHLKGVTKSRCVNFHLRLVGWWVCNWRLNILADSAASYAFYLSCEVHTIPLDVEWGYVSIMPNLVFQCIKFPA